MKSEVFFGPAGNPIGFKGLTVDVCDYLHQIGLDAYEYQATYGVRIQKQSALRLGKKAKKNNIRLSMHAPYYINLSSPKKDVLERSVQRLVQAARASDWMGAQRIVFHPGFYTNYTPSDAMKRCKNTIHNLIEGLSSLGIDNYTFAPETTGKKSQLGNLDEIIDICQSFDNFVPTIDYAHIHARDNGLIKDKTDYYKIFQKIEDELSVKSLHSHFTHIEYTDKGEVKHHVLLEEGYGPPFIPLMEVIIECGWEVTVICETPLLEKDALLMKSVYQDVKGL
jgi:deoxyribonuclease-4